MAKNARLKNSHTQLDGGRFALVGFTQQMLGSAAAFVRCMSQEDDLGDGESGAIFEIEIHGQDESTVTGTPHGGRRRLLKQYKVSSRNRKISLPAAKEIVKALRTSRKAASQQGEEIETVFELCTNQEPSKPAATFLSSRNVKIVEHDPHQAREGLRGYAATFGVMGDEELQRGIDRVIGRFFHIGSDRSSHQITKADFNRALTGFPNPLSIAIPEACEQRSLELEFNASMLQLDNAFLAGREAVIEAIGRWTNEALIVLVGGGGCGKTTALLQILRGAMTASGQSSRILACLLLPSKIAPETVETLVATWRGAPVSGNSGAGNDEAIKRLCYANAANRCPLLILGLDGIDEIQHTNPWYWSAGHLIDFFWRLHLKHARGAGDPPPARLLVTCRQRDEIRNFITYPTGIDYKKLGIDPDFVSVGEFSRRELESLLQETSTIQADVKQKIMDKVGEGSLEEYRSRPATERGTIELAQPIWIRLIHQPIIWRFFASLIHDQQLSLIEGEGEAAIAAGDAIARRYLEWFLLRTFQRHKLDQDAVREGLIGVSSRFAPADGPHSWDHWRDTLLPVLEGDEIRTLRRESTSVGIIDEIPRSAFTDSSWQWRYEFFWSYLRKGAD